jgi:hypothetical protein
MAAKELTLKNRNGLLAVLRMQMAVDVLVTAFGYVLFIDTDHTIMPFFSNMGSFTGLQIVVTGSTAAIAMLWLIFMLGKKSRVPVKQAA